MRLCFTYTKYFWCQTYMSIIVYFMFLRNRKHLLNHFHTAGPSYRLFSVHGQFMYDVYINNYRVQLFYYRTNKLKTNSITDFTDVHCLRAHV